MKQTTITPYFEELYRTTGELLDRVKQFDRDSRNAKEIGRLHEDYSGIEFSKSFHSGSRIWMERAITNLERIKSRLLTIMEDLLYTA